MLLGAKDITYADFSPILFYINLTMKIARLTLWERVIYVPERINERTLISNFIISRTSRKGDVLLTNTNLNRTSEKSIFDVNMMLRNYGLTRLRMLSTKLNWVYRFTA